MLLFYKGTNIMGIRAVMVHVATNVLI